MYLLQMLSQALLSWKRFLTYFTFGFFAFLLFLSWDVKSISAFLLYLSPCCFACTDRGSVQATMPLILLRISFTLNCVLFYGGYFFRGSCFFLLFLFGIWFPALNGSLLHIMSTMMLPISFTTLHGKCSVFSIFTNIFANSPPVVAGRYITVSKP